MNVNKTKGMQLLFGKKSSVSKVDPCHGCGKQIGCNSIQCTKCLGWVHPRCFDVPRQVSLLSCQYVSIVVDVSIVVKHGNLLLLYQDDVWGETG